MDLWIRNQKGRLTKISDIMQPIEDKFDNIRGWVLYAVKQSDAMFPLGIYKSKERALEVLDEIQNLLIPKTIVNTFNIEKKDMLNGNQYSIFENNIKDFSIEQFDTYVYEMPKE